MSVKLNWIVSGVIDSFSIYRATSPINPSALPTPLAAGITNNEYIDTSPIVGLDNYYRVATVKNGSLKISKEVVHHPSGVDFAIDMQVESGAWVNKGSTTLSMLWVGTPTFETNAIVLNGTQWLDVTNNAIFNFGTDSFEYTNEVYLTNISQWRILLSAKYYTGTAYAQFGFDAGRPYIGESWGGFGANLIASTAVTINAWNVIKLKRTPTLLQLFINDVIVASKTIATSVSFNFNRNAGGTRLFNITWSNQNSPFVGKVRRVTLRKL